MDAFGVDDLPFSIADRVTGAQVLTLLGRVIPRVLAQNTWLRPGTVTTVGPLSVDVEGVAVTPDNPLAVTVSADQPVWVLVCPEGALLLGARTEPS